MVETLISLKRGHFVVNKNINQLILNKMALTIEELYVKKIEGGIRSIRVGNKTPDEILLRKSFERLQAINDGLCDDLLNRYHKTVNEYKNKIENNTKKFGFIKQNDYLCTLLIVSLRDYPEDNKWQLSYYKKFWDLLLEY